MPDADGSFPSDAGNPNSAIPVYKVTGTPTDSAAYSDDQGDIAQNPPTGAVPVRIVGKPTANADGSYPGDPADDNSAIPVYFVNAPTPESGAYANAQTTAGGAIPVWVVNG